MSRNLWHAPKISRKFEFACKKQKHICQSVVGKRLLIPAVVQTKPIEIYTLRITTNQLVTSIQDERKNLFWNNILRFIKTLTSRAVLSILSFFKHIAPLFSEIVPYFDFENIIVCE